MIFLYLFIFCSSVGILYFVGNWIIDGLSRVSRFLNIREFVIAFILMALTASLPNLSVGILSIIRGVPILSFGDVIGGNVVDLTLAIGLAILFSKSGISTNSKTVQFSALYTFGAAILPVVLVLDNNLSRIDGVILIGAFIFFLFWLFVKKERFTQTYTLDERHGKEPINGSREIVSGLWKIILGIILLLLAGEGIVRSALFFSGYFNVPLGVIGLLVVGLGNALPETYFAVVAAKKGQTWMVLGDLMGAVIFPATLVLGLVGLFSPIENIDFSPFFISRIFIILAGFFFFFFIKTGKQLTKKEAFWLLSIYIVFLIVEVLRLR